MHNILTHKFRSQLDVYPGLQPFCILPFQANESVLISRLLGEKKNTLLSLQRHYFDTQENQFHWGAVQFEATMVATLQIE